MYKYLVIKSKWCGNSFRCMEDGTQLYTSKELNRVFDWAMRWTDGGSIFPCKCECQVIKYDPYF